jgi:ankyrin repeat protein/uncharacterized protein YecT (DUF1311 family)
MTKATTRTRRSLFAGLVLCLIHVSSFAASADVLVALVKGGSVEGIQAYLATPGVDINDRPEIGKALLDYAAEQNQLVIATYLLDHGAKVEAASATGLNKSITALHRAAYFDAIDVLDLLVARGAVIDARQENGPTPLVYAASNGSLRTAAALIKNGADVSAKFSHGQTPISEALKHGHMAMVRLLVDHGATPSAESLGDAAIQGHLNAVHFLLGVTVDQKIKNTALRFAILGTVGDFAERTKIIDELLASGAQIDNQIDNRPGTPLMLASTPEMFELLLQRGANQKARVPDAVLLQALGCNREVKDLVGILTVMLAHGVDFSPIPAKGQSALACTVIFGRPKAAAFLLDHGTPPNRPDAQGRLALSYSATPAMTEVLLGHGADINAIDPSHRTALSTAIGDRRTDIALFLLSKGADFRRTDLPGGSAMSLAARLDEPAVLAAMLDRGAEINARDARGNSPLDAAIDAHREQVVKLLLQRSADVNARGPGGASPLHLAASLNSLTTVTSLLDAHADTKARDDDGYTPLNRATSADVRALLGTRMGLRDLDQSSTADASVCREVQELARTNTLLSRLSETEAAPTRFALDEDAAFLSNVESLRVLKTGRDAYIVGMGKAPVFLARRGPDAVDHIVCEFATDPDTGASSLRILTEFQRLQARGDRENVSMSIASLKQSGIAGAQALLEASRRQARSLELDSDTDVLSDAIRGRRDDVLRFYLDQGVNPNLKAAAQPSERPFEPSRDLPLVTAFKFGSPESLRLLLDHGADPNATTEILRDSIMTLSVRDGSLATMKVLLDYGADPDISPSAIFHVLDEIGRAAPSADAQSAAVHLLLVRGGNTNAWIFQAFQPVARAKDREDLLILALNSPRVRTAWIESALASPGRIDPRLEMLLRDAAAIRDSVDCSKAVSVEEWDECLPNAVRNVENELAARIAARASTDSTPSESASSSQRAWREGRDRACGIAKSAVSKGSGWLARVLGNPSKARCVLDASGRRLASLDNGGK